MDLRQLRYFVAIIQCGSISRAALRLSIAQPALSLHIRNMELELETPLLFRTPHGVQPTEAGNSLFRNARTILDQFETARQEIKGQTAEPSGEVRVGLPSSVSQILGVPLVLAARERVPKVTLCVAEAMSGYVLDWLRQGRVDFGLLYHPVDDRNLRSVALLSEMLVLFGPVEAPTGTASPAEGPVPFARCAGLPLILPSSGHGLRDLVEEAAAARGVRIAPLVEIDAYAGIKALVERRLGYSVLPAYAIQAEVAEGRLRAWSFDPPLARTVHLAEPTDRPLSHAVKAVERLCVETLRDLVGTGAWSSARMLDAD